MKRLMPWRIGPIGELHGGEAADLPGQLGIEIAAGIVRDAREMNDRVDAPEIDLVGIANIALDDRQIGMRFQEIAEPHDVERDDLMAVSQQLGDKYAALVAASTSDEHFHCCDCCPRRMTGTFPCQFIDCAER